MTMQLYVHEGIVTLGHDCIIKMRPTRQVGEFGDSDEDTEAAVGFAQGHAEKLIGPYRTCADTRTIFFGPANDDGEALGVWVEVVE